MNAAENRRRVALLQADRKGMPAVAALPTIPASTGRKVAAGQQRVLGARKVA